MSKKFLKIFIINLVLVIIILFLAEVLCIFYTFKIRKLTYPNIKLYITRVLETYTSNDYFYDYYFRPVSNPSNPSGKPALVTLGCSYTYGLYLEQEETFASQLAEATGRTVYNLGVTGSSPRETLYILSNDELRNKLLNNETNIEYFFYTFISNHLPRIYANIKINPLRPHYKLKNGHLEYYEKNRFLQKSYIYRTLMELKYKNKDDIEAFNLFLIYMKEINEQIKIHYPNAKLVILLHEDYLRHDWSELEKEGIIVIKNYEMINTLSPEYTHSNVDVHPNAKAWEIIVPKIVDYLKL